MNDRHAVDIERDWPTPSFDRPDTIYECSGCGQVVNPKNGDKQAALLVAGSTLKLCGDCAEEMRGGIHA